MEMNFQIQEVNSNYKFLKKAGSNLKMRQCRQSLILNRDGIYDLRRYAHLFALALNSGENEN